MGRPLRCFVPLPSLYHVCSHASDNRRLFVDPADSDEFVERLATTMWRYEIGLVSWVLVGNHYHAIVETPDARLSAALQHLHGRYSAHHNRRHGRSAHLFRAHPFIRRIVDERQFLATVRYLALNPVHAGLAQHALDWRWSSARVHAGVQPPPEWAIETPLAAVFGTNWRERYRAYIANEKDPPERVSRVAGAGFEPATSGL